MENKLRIAIFTECFYPGTGGAEKAVECLANTFVDLGHEVMVCAPKYWDCEERGQYICNRTKSIKVAKNSFLPRPGKSKEFKQKLDEFNPQIIHCNGNNAMLSFAVKYGKKHNIPVVYTAHTKLKMYVETKLHSKLLAKIFVKWVGKKIKKCAKITAVSQSMRGEFDSYGYKDKFEVIKNGCTFNKVDVNDELKQIAQTKYNISENDNILLFVGHVETCKNIYFIFDALKKLHANYKNFKMIFVGSVDEKKFKKRVEKSEISENVMFTGQITDRNLLSSLYANTKLFLFPSIFDNDSLAIIESAVHGVPSMVLKDTGSSERITDEYNGFIVDSVDDMANKIEKLLNEKSKITTVGQNACQSLPQDWSIAGKKYIELFNSILSKNHKE